MITSDGIDYYAYILVCVDDILIIDKNPKQFMDLLKDTYTVKPSSTGEPKIIWKQISVKHITPTIHTLGQWDHNPT